MPFFREMSEIQRLMLQYSEQRMFVGVTDCMHSAFKRHLHVGWMMQYARQGGVARSFAIPHRIGSTPTVFLQQMQMQGRDQHSFER